jgi:hypothetical protein
VGDDSTDEDGATVEGSGTNGGTSATDGNIGTSDTVSAPDNMNEIIADFLMQFPMMFGGNVPNNAPTEALWRLDDLVASGFMLYDFDNNGIPAIHIMYSNAEDPGIGFPTSLFRFVDGEYRRVKTTHNDEWRTEPLVSDVWSTLGEFSHYFRDNNGNLIRHGFHYRSSRTHYHSLEFGGDNTATVNTAVSFDDIPANMSDDEWWEMWSHEAGNEWCANTERHIPVPHNLPATTNLLTPIEPLTALQSEIESAVRQRLR